MSILSVRIKALMPSSDVLAGSDSGRRLFARLLEAVPEPSPPEAVFLDFGGIRVATASFLRDGPLAFRDWARARNSRIYPVFANLSQHVLDELSVYLSTASDAALVCTIENDQVRDVRLIGRLDEKQQIAFDLIRKHRQSTAVALSRLSKEKVGPTTWNNRLAALAAKGLIIESNAGRTKHFRLAV